MNLNIGSGQRKFASPWINVDRVYTRKHVRVGNDDVDAVPDVAADGNALPFPDNTSKMIVLHHVLEHFHLGDGDALIHESYRILEGKGSLLVFTPDLRKLAQRWLTGQIDDFIYTVNLYGAWMGLEGDDHHWNWSQEGLIRYLGNLEKWKEVKPFMRRTIPGADIAFDWWIASAECIK